MDKQLSVEHWDQSLKVTESFNGQSGIDDFFLAWAGTPVSDINALGVDVFIGDPLFPTLASSAVKPRRNEEPYSFMDRQFYRDAKNRFKEATAIRELPARRTLPDDMKNFVDDLKGKSMLEKAAAIQIYVNKKMEYELPEGPDPFIAVGGVIDAGFVGDCDDHSILSCALLRYAGVPDEDVHLLVSRASYNGTEPAGHAVTIFKVDGQNYLLDMNLQTPVAMDGFKVKGEFTHEGFPPGTMVDVEITPLISYNMEKNDPYYLYPALTDSIPKIDEVKSAPLNVPVLLAEDTALTKSTGVPM